MRLKHLAKLLFLAWGIPLSIVCVGIVFTPEPNRPRESFPSEVFKPSRVASQKKQLPRGTDWFELWLDHPDGRSFIHRAPDQGPIMDLDHRIPRNSPLKIVYWPSLQENVLLEISLPDADAKPILSFQDVTAQYSFRRRFVYLVAGIWFAVGSLFMYGLWRTEIPSSEPDFEDDAE